MACGCNSPNNTKIKNVTAPPVKLSKEEMLRRLRAVMGKTS